MKIREDIFKPAGSKELDARKKEYKKKAKKFIVHISQYYDEQYRVEALNRDEAIDKVHNGMTADDGGVWKNEQYGDSQVDNVEEIFPGDRGWWD